MPRVFLPSVVSAVLLWAAFFPLDLGALGFVALVPWLSLVRADVSRRRRYAAAYLGGFVFSALATEWVRVAHPMMYASWAAFSLVLPLFWVLALDLIRRLDRVGVPLAFAVPVVWVALEYMRMHFPTGYPFLKPLGLYQMIGFGWYFLGYTQHAFLPLIQIADLGGVYAVSFIVAAVNGMLADWMLRSTVLQRLLKWEGEAELSSPFPAGKGAGGLGLLSSLAVLALVGMSFAYGYTRLQHPAFAPGPRVAAIQGSVPQAEKNKKGVSLAETYIGLHKKAADENPDLIVWPETCFPDEWIEIAPGQTPTESFAKDAAACEAWFRGQLFQSPTLLGLNGIVWEDGRAWKYNSALLLSPMGEFKGRYDKMHLVPFGEYVPFGETLPFMRWFTPYEGDYSCRPGDALDAVHIPHRGSPRIHLRVPDLLRGFRPLPRAAVCDERASQLLRQHLERWLVRRHRGARTTSRDLPLPRHRSAAVDRAGREHGHLRGHRPRRPRDCFACGFVVGIEEDGRRGVGRCAARYAGLALCPHRRLGACRVLDRVLVGVAVSLFRRPRVAR